MFEVLTAHGDDAKRWDAYVEALPYDLRDVHFTSAWGRANETGKASARLAVLEAEGRVVLRPFLVRAIDGTGWSDITAAGYGGLVSSNALPSREDGAAFEREMQAWRADNRVVSEFYLINPIFAAHQMLLADGANLRPVKDVVILHLGSDEEMLKGMRATRRHALDKAAGAPIADWSVAEFANLYGSAMERKGAPARWRLGPDYFTALATALGADATLLAAGTYGHAAAIFLFGKAVAYYHLAATAPEPPTGYADAVVTAGAQQARSRGCDWLHLGGGVTADKDDSLLAYKRSFGGMTRVVYAVRRVVDDAAYLSLCGEAGVSAYYDKPSDFFPAYRAKEAA